MVGTRRKPCQPLVWHSAVLFLALHAALVCALPVSQTGLGPNQPPHIAVPAAISTTTRTTASLGGLHVTDPDVGDDFDGVLTVTIAPAMGGQVLLSSAAGLAVSSYSVMVVGRKKRKLRILPRRCQDVNTVKL